MTMSVGPTTSSTSATAAALLALQNAAPTKQAVQVSLLKKVLEQQQSEAQMLMKMAEGKGRVIDIRV